MSAPKVFISYSHKDEQWMERLRPHLGVLEKEGLLDVWVDTQIGAGEEWKAEIEKAINAASVAIMLISADFLTSNFIRSEEVPKFLKRREAEGVRIFPVIIRPCVWQEVGWLRVILARPKDGRPLSGGNDHQIDADLAAIVKEVAAIIKRAASVESAEGFIPLPPDKISLAKMPSTNPELFGREKELETLDKAWENPKTNIISLVAFGGVGKTALVNNWLKRVANDNWRGAQRVLGWSFYSQGAAEGKQVSADQFIAYALGWFGDDDPTKGSPWDKGERLAELVKKQRTLLILDGLEPLQNPHGPEKGGVKDPALRCLLRQLANQNPGLCIITSRLKVDDIKDFVGSSAVEHDLDQLSPKAGAQFLSNLGVKNATDDELKEAVAEYDGHALALELLGNLLSIAFNGDIRLRNEIPPLMVDEEKGGHARRIMESYEKWFKGKAELEILYVMGLFDRPAEGGAIKVLRAKPSIKGLTTKIQKLTDVDWKYALKNLREAGLLSPEDPNDLDTLDCHPLVREHFGEKLEKKNPGAWKDAHSRLYDYYRSVPEKEFPDTIEEMAPLFAAVTHGCLAGRHQEAFLEVYWKRISRTQRFFSTNKLGAFSADLAALSGFFGGIWLRPVDNLRDADKIFVIGQVGFRLLALGRLVEAVQPMEGSLKGFEKLKNWKAAAICASNLSGLFLAMGNLNQATRYARQSVEYADRSGDEFWRVCTHADVADRLHQLGRLAEAESVFREAEEIQKASRSECPFLYALQGFQYCDLLLGQGEYADALNRAAQTLEWAKEYLGRGLGLPDIGLDHVSLGRALLDKAQVGQPNNFSKAVTQLNEAVDSLRESGTQHNIPRGLLARAELYRVQGNIKKAQRDVDEAKTIATRGGMRLYIADCHLEYARLYLATGQKEKAQESLETAAKMIEEMGYHRRDPEVHLAYAQLYFAEENKDKAREHLDTATKMIDEMGMHRWDKEAEDLAKLLAK